MTGRRREICKFMAWTPTLTILLARFSRACVACAWHGLFTAQSQQQARQVDRSGHRPLPCHTVQNGSKRYAQGFRPAR